jgi:LAGLIDADG-like domain
VGSENPIGADNQQGSRSSALSVGGLTPQRLHAELLAADARETRAYLLGASRDGTFNRTHETLRISQSDPRWLTGLQVLFLKLGSRSWIYREGRRNVWVIETKHRLEDETILRARTEKSAFVRGYFDAEGGIPRNTADRFYIQLVQKDLADLTRVRTILEEIDIHCGRIHNPSISVDSDYWRFYVLAESHEDFIRSVSSWHPRKRMLLDRRIETRMKI